MTLQAVVGELCFPNSPFDMALQIRTNTITGGSGHALAMIFRCPKAGDIRRIHFLINAITSSGTIDVRLETVSTANGDPTGTLVDTNSNNSSTFSSTGWVDSGDFGGNATVTKDQVVAVVLDAGTFDGAIQLTDVMYPNTATQIHVYSDLFNGSSWTKNDFAMLMAVEYADADDIVPIHGIYSFQSVTNEFFNNTDTPDVIGIKFQLPFPARLVGAWAQIELDGDTNIDFYSTGTTIPGGGTIALDKDQRFGAADSVFYGYFPTAQILAKDTDYRIAIKPTTSTTIQIPNLVFNSATMLKGMNGGSIFHRTEKTDAGSFSDTTTERPMIGILLDQFDDGVGGGGGGLIVHPGMTGGFNA